MPTPRIGQFSSTRQPARVSQPVSGDARDRQQAEAALDAERAEVEDYQPQHVEMSAYEKSKLEQERTALTEAIRDTRPRQPAPEVSAPVSLDPRVKPAPEALATVAESVASVVSVAPAIPVSDGLVEAERQYAKAEEALAAATVAFADAQRALAHAQADYAAQEADQQLQRHRAILVPALAAAKRQQAAFQRLFEQYGGVGRGGVSRGPLARYAKTLPQGEAKRREQLMTLYREAGLLMEKIRLGYGAALAAVTACDTALSRGGTGDYADLRLELAGRECEAASAHDPNVVRAACEQLIAAIKTLDGEPGPEVVGRIDPSETVRSQAYAEGVGSPILPS